MWCDVFKLCQRIVSPRRNRSYFTMNKTKNCPKELKSKCLLGQGRSLNKTTGKIHILPTPVKSESDKKDYKVIRLLNGLTACLISDHSPITQACDEVESEGSGDSCASESEDHGSESEESSIDSYMSGSEEGEEDVHMLEPEDDEGNHRKHVAPEHKMAAAGLCIDVGSFSDPKEVPGMAHFLEHMVFMGSEKYPKENAFDQFIKDNGGSDNASTDTETTVFYFECLEKHLAEALDRFSQFFISPLMKRDAITREREAIESEFQMALPSDSSRKEQLLCTFAKKDSPVNTFAWGNLITLRDNINDEDLYNGVHIFRKRHYSAHRMTLAVQARLPLDKLEECVINCFSNVPSNNLPADNFPAAHQDVFSTADFNRLYYIKPVKDLCQVDITWALPSLKDKYEAKPHHYLSYLLGDEGKGSLLSYLKKKLWVLGTTIGNGETGSEHNSLYTLFTVNLNLTDAGYDHLNEVIESVFSYLKMLKEIGSQKRIFDEIQAISNVAFKYAKEEPAVDIVEEMCEAMQFYPSEHYLTGTELYFHYDPDAINFVMNYLIPDKANIMILGKTPEDHVEFDKTEKWFGTQYTVRDIPKKWMNQWNNAKIIEELSVPPPNHFITKDFSILPDVNTNPEYPEEILKNSLVELWYRQDIKFKLPVAYYYFYLISPLAALSAKHACLMESLVNLLSIDVSEEIYPATSADLSHFFGAYEKGLIIKVSGYNEKLPTLIELILKHLIHLSDNITEDMFNAIKDKLIKSYYNKLLKPSQVSKEIRLNLLVDHHWNAVDKYYAISEISFEDVKEFIKTFLKCFYLKALVQGNVEKDAVLKTVNNFVNTLNFDELDKKRYPKFNVVKVNQGEISCRIQNFNKNDSNSIITNYYQSGPFTIKESVIIDLIMMVIEEPLFDILRTKEQLGYEVYCSIRDTFGVLGYTITVSSQATKTTTQYVDDRIESFLQHSRTLLQKLDEKAFESIKKNTIKMKQCIDVHLKEEVDRNWTEIISDDYIFSRIKQEIEAINNTTLDMVRSWWDNHNSWGNRENYRKISVQIVGSTGGSQKESPAEKKPQITYLCDPKEAKACITNIIEYKKTVDILTTK